MGRLEGLVELAEIFALPALKVLSFIGVWGLVGFVVCSEKKPLPGSEITMDENRAVRSLLDSGKIDDPVAFEHGVLGSLDSDKRLQFHWSVSSSSMRFACDRDDRFLSVRDTSDVVRFVATPDGERMFDEDGTSCDELDFSKAYTCRSRFIDGPGKEAKAAIAHAHVLCNLAQRQMEVTGAIERREEVRKGWADEAHRLLEAR